MELFPLVTAPDKGAATFNMEGSHDAGCSKNAAVDLLLLTLVLISLPVPLIRL